MLTIPELETNVPPILNSDANEFRPILVYFDNHAADMVCIFSSDREGGKGGYDLYFSIVPKAMFE